MSKKHKNRIGVEESLNYLRSVDFRVKVINDYQFRLWLPELTADAYDWYHTSGTLVVNRENRSPASINEKAFTAEDVHELIFKVEGNHEYI